MRTAGRQRGRRGRRRAAGASVLALCLLLTFAMGAFGARPFAAASRSTDVRAGGSAAQNPQARSPRGPELGSIRTLPPGPATRTPRGSSPGLATRAENPATAASSEPVYAERIVEEYRVRTTDGVIYGVVERPVVPAGMRVPVILTYSPYRYLSGSAPGDPRTRLRADKVSDFFVPRGYARAFFDLVGTGESSGCMDFGGPSDGRTGAAVVEFLAAQPWASGRVGMIGASYAGATQWATAIQRPPNLTTIVPQVAVSSWFEYLYMHGVAMNSGSQTVPAAYLLNGGVPPSAAGGGVDWAGAVQARATPCDRVAGMQRTNAFPNPTYDDFWRARDYQAAVEEIRTPALLVGSWADQNVHPNQTIDMWQTLAPTLPRRLVMGQAGHTENQLPDIQALYLEWFDHWLKGFDNQVMSGPPVISVTNTGRTVSSSVWPLATRSEVFDLVPGAGSTSALGLSGAPPTWTDDVPYMTEYFPASGLSGDAALLYRGAPLPQGLAISGSPTVELSIRTSGVSTHVHAVLVDYDQAGAWTTIARAVLNSRYRAGDHRPEPFDPGTTWEARLSFQPVDWDLEPGHRLGLALMSVNGTEGFVGDTVKSTNTIIDVGRLRLPLR